jgi:hypothetical protein
MLLHLETGLHAVPSFLYTEVLSVEVENPSDSMAKYAASTSLESTYRFCVAVQLYIQHETVCTHIYCIHYPGCKHCLCRGSMAPWAHRTDAFIYLEPQAGKVISAL